MYSLKESQSEVSNYAVHKDILAVLNKQNHLYLNQKLITTSKIETVINSHQGKLFYGYNEDTFIIDLEVNTTNKIKNYTVDSRSLIDEKAIGCKILDIEKLLFKYDYLDINNNKVIFELPGFDNINLLDIIPDNNNYYVLYFSSRNNKIIEAISYKNGSTKWQFQLDTPVKGKINYIIGVWKENIFLSVNAAEIISINKKDGSLNRHWINNTHEEGVFIPYYMQYSMELLPSESKIVGLFGFTYWEFNLLTEQLIIEDLTDEFKSHQLKSDKVNFQGKYALFTSSINAENGKCHKIGVLDRASLKIIWTYHFDNTERFFFRNEAPTMSGDFLYLLNMKGTLHIFEKKT